MSPSRVPNTDSKLDQLLSGMGEVKGRIAGMGEQLSELRGDVSEVRERVARAENANASTAKSNLNGYREHDRRLEHMSEKLELVSEHFNRLDEQVRGLTNVAKEATLEAAPDVARAVADRVNEDAQPDRRKTRKTVIQGAVGAGVLAAVVPTVNFLTLHPRFLPQSLDVVGTALSGIAKAMAMPS